MVQNGARRGATNVTIPLMLGAFALLAGFLYWLSIMAVPTAPPEITEEDAPAVVLMESQIVDPATFEVDPDGYTGVTVRLDGVNVAQAVGDRSFFIDLPRTPFLVHMGSDLVAAGETIPATGAPVTVIGDVVAMNDSIVSAWADAGEFADADRVLIEFATHFIEALQLAHDGGAGGDGAAAGGEGG
ncbi:MAG: hypothetical protein HKO98_15425 [Gemmatimonadetes bacterium]|nr:hypothetical protein [Gemmatimonadota bacterium]